MSAISSNAIVITAYPGKHGSITMPARNAQLSLLPEPVDFDSDDSSGGGGPKKRRRLTHLSPDEKLLRRKLKNRVAAQTARDRKKALMVELEEKVAQLEEENKLLKKQNSSLKEASSTLAKENAALKYRLSEQPVATTKTDSEPKSTCCSSAEGTGSDSVSVDGTVLHLCADAQPDDFFGLLQEFTENIKCEQPQTQTATSLSQSVCGRTTTNSPNIEANHRIAAPGMVGLTPAELESLNELISIDHVYVKPQPLNLQGGKGGQLKSSENLLKQEHTKGSSLSPHYKCVTTGTKRTHTGKQLIQPALITHTVVAPSPKTELDNTIVNPHFTESSLLPTTAALSTQMDVPAVADDLMNTFTDSDMETSLNLFQDFDLNLIDCKDGTELAKENISENLAIPGSVQNFPSASTENELSATKLFDEIYEHYLSIKASDSPDPSNLSDSGVSSEGEAMSPFSGDETLHDDVLWHDTSFADLFPDLH